MVLQQTGIRICSVIKLRYLEVVGSDTAGESPLCGKILNSRSDLLRHLIGFAALELHMIVRL